LRLLPLLPALYGSIDRPAPGRRPHGLRDRALAAGHLGQRRGEQARALRALRRALEARGLARLPDQVLEALVVAVLERGSLALAVIGEDHELVRTRCVLRGRHDPAELAVDLAQDRECVWPLDAGMVGDLVVGEEG